MVAIFDIQWTNDQLNGYMQPFISNLFEHFGDQVRAGPFKGMRLNKEGHWDAWTMGTKLLGGYEIDIQPSIEVAIKRNPKTVINVGCAEGYYAVGMATRLPNATVFGIDIDDKSLELCKQLAKKNDTQVTTLNGATEASSLKLDMAGGPYLYVMDCEGAEWDLLVPKENPLLKHADLIVECHDFQCDWEFDALFMRFSQTHSVGRIMPSNNHFMFELWCKWPGYDQSLMMLDRRPAGASWMVAWAKERE